MDTNTGTRRLCTRAGMVALKRARAEMLRDEARALTFARLAIECRAVPEWIEAPQLAEAFRATMRMPIQMDRELDARMLLARRAIGEVPQEHWTAAIDRQRAGYLTAENLQDRGDDLPWWVYVAMLGAFLAAWAFCEFNMKGMP